MQLQLSKTDKFNETTDCSPITEIPRISGKAAEYIGEVLRSQFKGSQGTNMVGRLEKAFATKFGAKFAISHCNGTATLHSALAAAGVRAGDEVIVPPLTMASTSLAVMHQNAVPVYADIDPSTFLIDAKSIRSVITPRTRAIMPVSLYGLSPDMDAIMEIAAEHGLAVIEDAAQCFLGYYKGRLVGTIGHFGSFSFQNSKHITCGEGGMIICNDEKAAERVRQFSSLGYANVGAEAGKSKINKNDLLKPDYARHVTYGWNYRLPDLCAAVALEQTERLEELVGMRIRSADLYRDALADCKWLFPQFVPDDCIHSYWAFGVRFDSEMIGVSRETFVEKFQELGGARLYASWRINYLEPFFQETSSCTSKNQEWRSGLCPIAEAVQPKLLQFKTNYLNLSAMKTQADVLRNTISFFE